VIAAKWAAHRSSACAANRGHDKSITYDQLGGLLGGGRICYKRKLHSQEDGLSKTLRHPRDCLHRLLLWLSRSFAPGKGKKRHAIVDTLGLMRPLRRPMSRTATALSLFN
jgi:hypothetical protein